MKNMIKTLLVAAFGAMLAWPASAGTATNITFTGQAPVGNYATDTAWSVSSGALADVGTLEQGVLTFDLDDGQYMTYAATSRTDRVATVKMEDTLFTVAFEPPAVPADSQAAIVVGAWEGTTNYYGWAGAMANGTNVWELLPTQVAITPETAVDVEMVFDYTAATKTVTFKVGGTTLGSLNLADQNRARVEGITFQGSGSISDLAGTYATTMWTFDFKDGDTVVESVQVEDGDAVAEIAAPSKTGHTFDAWQSGGSDYNFASAVTADAFVTAKYDPIAYTITWIANGGTLSGEYTSGEVNYGTPIVPPNATKEADAQYTYSFDKWVPAPDATVLSNATYTAQFDSTVNTYTITWKDGDGETLKTETLAYGATPSYSGTTPTKTGDSSVTYTFNNTWLPTIVDVVGDATYTAQFNSEVNTFDVTFYTNDVATASWTTNVAYGTVPQYLAPAPTKAADSQYTWFFAGFTNTVATVPTNLFDTVTADVSYYAVFTNTVNQYTVTFENDDNTVLDTQTLAYNASVIYGGEPPAKDGGDQYVYTWTGWTDGENAYATDATLPVVTGAKTYTATYSSLTKVSAPSAASGLVYDGASQTGVSAGTGYSLDGHTATDAGSYTATATLAAGYIWSDETTGAKTIPWSIAPKTVGLNWGATAFNYTGSAQVPTATLTAADIVGNDDVSVSVSGAQTNVGGPYTATATLVGTDAANYALPANPETTTFTIGKAALVFSVSMNDWTYGGTAADPEVTFTTGSGTATYTYSADGSTWSSEKPTAAGDYTVKATVAASENYNAGEATDTFTIAKAEIAVPSGSNATYDGTPKTGLAEGTGYTRGGDYTATAAGDYTATATPDANHTWVGGSTAAENVSWSIAPATVVVTADAKTQVYGAEAQPLTYTAGSLVTGNSFSGELAREAGDNVGTYAITIGSLTAGSNYTISFAGANYTITGAAITPVVSLDGWTYGDTPEEPSVTGNTGSGEVTYSYSADNGESWTTTQPSEPGTYLVKASVAASGNYAAGESASVSFTIAEAVFPTLALAKPTLASTALANAQSGAVVRATIDPTATVNATNATADVVVDGTTATATFTSLPWNEAVDWMLQSTDAADLPGRFYAKRETEWFNVATNAFTEVNDLADGMKGVDMSADPSAAGQMVRIQTCLEIPEGAMEEFPAGVGDARTGFAVAKIADNGDTAPAFYAYTGDGAQGVNGWVKLLGAAPAANTTNDLLIVLDVEAATARYYVEGIALYKDNAGTHVYAIPMKAFEANEEKQINGIGFANADGVLSPVVAEYDVPFEAAVGDVPYAAAADGLSNADKTGVRTLYLLTNDVAGTISLAVGESVKVDTAKGSFAEAEPVVTSAGAGYEVVSNAVGTLTTYSVDPIVYSIAYELDGGDWPTGYTATNTYTVASPAITLASPEKTDYNFLGWVGTGLTGTNATVTIASGSTGDRAYTSIWQRAAVTIRFLNYDGSVLQSSDVDIGQTPVYSGETPAKPATAQYSYEWTGWEPAIVPAAAAADYTATFSETLRSYDVTFSWHGDSETTSYEYGQTPTAPAIPASYVENGKIYTFQNWNATIVSVEAAATYTAVYDEGVTAVATVFTVANNGATTNTVGTYATLAQAVAAAVDGATVLLLDDVTLTERVEPNAGANTVITIDLGGNKITRTGTSGNGSAFDVKSGDVTIRNGEIDCTQDDTAIAKDGVYAITSRSGSNVTLADLTVTVDSECGACAYPFAGSTMTIESGTYANVTTTPYRYNTAITGMAVNQPNIDDGNGHFVVQAGYNVTFDADGGTPAPAAQRVAAGGKATAPVTNPAKAGSVFAGWTLNDAAYDFDTVLSADITLVADYDAAVATVFTVAGATTNTVGYYTTLAGAVGAAVDGATVLLLDDVMLDTRVEPNVGANTAITIDLGGNTITREGTSGNGSAFDVKSGDVTIRNGEIDCTQDDTAIAKDGVYAITSRSGSTVTLADLAITVDSECGACAYPFAGSTMTIESGTYANVTTTPYRYNTAITGMAVNQPNTRSSATTPAP